MRSAANASQRSAERLASLTFFLDHQIGRHIVADKLREVGATVEVHLEHFKGDAPDLEWIPEIGRRNWVLITKDQNIRRNPLERAAYAAAKLRGFVATGKDMSGSELGEQAAQSDSIAGPADLERSIAWALQDPRTADCRQEAIQDLRH